MKTMTQKPYLKMINSDQIKTPWVEESQMKIPTLNGLEYQNYPIWNQRIKHPMFIILKVKNPENIVSKEDWGIAGFALLLQPYLLMSNSMPKFKTLKSISGSEGLPHIGKIYIKIMATVLTRTLQMDTNQDFQK